MNTCDSCGQAKKTKTYGKNKPLSANLCLDCATNMNKTIKDTAKFLKKKGYPSLAKIITEPKQKPPIRLHKKKDINKLLSIDAMNDE